MSDEALAMAVLDEAKALEAIGVAADEVDLICRGERRFTMSIPAREDDSDILISTALTDARDALLAAARREAALREERDRLAALVEEAASQEVAARARILRRSKP